MAKAVRIHSFGDPSVLRYEDIPEPTPKPGEAVVQIDAAGVNFIDVYHRTGLYPISLPLTLGQEAAGTVVAVGNDVTTLKAGDRVAWTGQDIPLRASAFESQSGFPPAQPFCRS